MGLLIAGTFFRIDGKDNHETEQSIPWIGYVHLIGVCPMEKLLAVVMTIRLPSVTR